MRDDDGANDDAEQGAREQGGARTGTEQPKAPAAVAKLGGCQDLNVGEVCLQLSANAVDI